MATTQLTPYALPGKPYSFVAKDEAPGSNPRDDTRFTELSNSALAGKIHSFLAKDEAIPPGTPRGTDRFTQLSTMALPGKQYLFPEEAADQITALQVYALPGKRLAFVAKESAVTGKSKTQILDIPEEIDYRRLLREDDEILTFILNSVTSGVLDN